MEATNGRKRLRKKIIQSRRKCIHLVSGRVCVGTGRAESYDSLGFSESASSRGHTAAKDAGVLCRGESKQAFGGVRYLRLVYLCGMRKNRIIPEGGKVFAEDTACMLRCYT